MADELLRMRTDFVLRVSSPVIAQLLDRTLEDGILHYAEHKSVYENRTTADQARDLIDTVRKKGERASRMLISYIQHVDPYLYDHLHLSCELPAPQAAVPQTEEEERVTLFTSQTIISAYIASMFVKLYEINRKQDKASRKMITKIKSKDPTLYSKLSCGQTAPPDADPQREKELFDLFLNSPTMKSTYVYQADQLSEIDIYPVTKKSIENRVALLITNIRFADKKQNRYGAEIDEANMKKLLRGLGYEVVTHRNLTGEAIDAAIKKFSEHPKLEETDSVVVVIMSHGKLGAVLGVDWKKEISGDEKPDEFPINNIYKHLGPEECKALTNKPKIIIIQACRGEEDGSVPVKDCANAAEPCEDVDQPGPSLSAGEQMGRSVRRVHREKDFISLLSCTPDAVSYRNPVKGSYLIQFVVEVFNTYKKKDHIEDLFTKILRRFEDLPIGSDLQMPTKDRCSLTKRFYFNPGL